MSVVQKRSVTINGHRTSISLEQAFFDQLNSVAAATGRTFAGLVAEIDRDRARATNLSSALRLYVLAQLTKS